MTHRLYEMNVESEQVTPLLEGDQALWGFSIARDGVHAAYLASTVRSPGDVRVAKLRASKSVRLTELNPQLKAIRFGARRVVRWSSPDGTAIEGLLIEPVNYRRGSRVPLLVQMEGTYGTYDLSFSGRVAADLDAPFPFQQQVFAGLGFAVLLPNPRGSWGYGAKFQLAGKGDFGTGPLADILSGVEAMIQRGIADSTRLGIMGSGFDGYRALLAITRTKKFKAASVDNALFDLVALHADLSSPGAVGPPATAIASLIGGTPQSAADEYARISPANFVDSLRTPVLITHYTQFPYNNNQAEQLERAVKQHGMVAERFPYTPSSPFGTMDPKTLEEAVARNAEWFVRWMAPLATSAAPTRRANTARLTKNHN
ncbi:MAG: alpha/beta hydrolase family protein [Gemmatimonadaceae bacterium]